MEIVAWTLSVKRKLGHVFQSDTTSATTEFRFFAECLRHSAKAKLHSAKPLPSAALGKKHTAKF